uniref:Uncharacterized protein n=1 Tax=Kalanchoe fedtschenkoi TaxID=63787 RepID=A0A7N0UV82_KALFE
MVLYFTSILRKFGLSIYKTHTITNLLQLGRPKLCDADRDDLQFVEVLSWGRWVLDWIDLSTNQLSVVQLLN